MKHAGTHTGRSVGRRHRVRPGGRLLRAMLAFALISGCTAAGPGGRETIHFITWNPSRPEVWKDLIAGFETRNPGVRVILELGPSSSTSFHDIVAQKLRNRGDDIDVFFMDATWVPEFAAAGWAAPLDDLFPAGERAGFLPAGIAANTWEGRLYGVPMFIDAGLLFYRSDLLEKYGFHPPATWRELALQAETITRGEARNGALIYGYSGQFKQYEGLVCNMQEFILGNNGSLLDPDTLEPEFDRPAALEAVRFVRDTILGRLSPGGALTYMEPESISLFIQGRAVFHRNWPYAWQIAGDPEGSRVAGRVGIARLPHFPGGAGRPTLGGWQLGINAHSGRRVPARGFVRFLAGEEIQKRFVMETGRAPARISLYRDPEILGRYPQFGKMGAIFADAAPRPRTPLYPAVSNELQRFFSTVLAEPGSDLPAAAREAARRIKWIQSMLKRKADHARR